MKTLTTLFLTTFSLATLCESACPPDFQYEQNGNDREFFCSLIESDNKIKEGRLSCDNASKEFQEVLTKFRRGTQVKFSYPQVGESANSPSYQGLDIPESITVKDRELKCSTSEGQLNCAIYLYPNFNGSDSIEPQVNPLSGLSQCIVEAQPDYMRPSVSVYNTDRNKPVKTTNEVPEPIRRPSGLSK